jgi:hypothetical protein
MEWPHESPRQLLGTQEIYEKVLQFKGIGARLLSGIVGARHDAYVLAFVS